MNDKEDDSVTQKIVWEIADKRYKEMMDILVDESNRKAFNDYIIDSQKKKKDVELTGKQNQIISDALKIDLEVGSLTENDIKEINDWGIASNKKRSAVKKKKLGNVVKKGNTGNSKSRIEEKIKDKDFAKPPEKDEVRKAIEKEIKEKQKTKFNMLRDALNDMESKIGALQSLVWRISSLENNHPSLINERGQKTYWDEVYKTDITDHAGLCKQFLEKAYTNTTQEGFKLTGIFPILAEFMKAVSVNLSYHTKAIVNVLDLIDAQHKMNLEVAKHGPKGWNEMNKMYKQEIFKKSEKYVEKEEWDKLTAFEKIAKSFEFRDYNQFPRVYLWKQLNSDERKKVLAKRMEWRSKRMIELLNAFNNKEDKAVKKIDTFIYYDQNRFDCKGYDIRLNDDENKIMMGSADDLTNFTKLLEIRIKEGAMRHIYNRVWIKGMMRATRGKCSTLQNLGFEPKMKKIEVKDEKENKSMVYSFITPVKLRNNSGNRARGGFRGRGRFGRQRLPYLGRKRFNRDSSKSPEKGISLKEESPNRIPKSIKDNKDKNF